MRIRAPRLISIIVPASLAVTLATAHAQFQGLGFYDPANPYSEAFAISGDGTTVVGSTFDADSNPRSFRWTQAGGFEILPILGNDPGFVYSEALSVSYDGSIVGGWDYNAEGPLQGYRWDAAQPTQMELIPYIPDTEEYGRSNAMSADGSVIVGSNPGASRWTSATGTLAIPGTDPDYSKGLGISADGLTVVGADSSDDLPINAFFWRVGDSAPTFISIDGGSSPVIRSEANATSADGSVVVGEFLRDDSTYGAFASTLEETIVLDTLDPSSYTSAYAVSADGLWAVGESGDLAALWDLSDNEVFDLNTLLAETYGYDLTGWTLTCATGISANGLTITGSGTDPDGNYQAWIATVPEPSTWALLTITALAVLVFRRRNFHTAR